MTVHAVIILFRAETDKPFDHERRYELPCVLRILNPGRIALRAAHGAVQHVFISIPIAQQFASSVELIDIHVNLFGRGWPDEENEALQKEIIFQLGGNPDLLKALAQKPGSSIVVKRGHKIFHSLP